jgi:hypothetical protein
VSLVFTDERTFTPGAETFGFRRFDPSRVTGPRLLKSASWFVMVIAPVEKEAS